MRLHKENMQSQYLKPVVLSMGEVCVRVHVRVCVCVCVHACGFTPR